MLRSRVKDCGGRAIVEEKAAKVRTLVVMWKASALRASVLYSIEDMRMGDRETGLDLAVLEA